MECVDIINTFVPCAVAEGMNPGLATLLSLVIGVVLVATLPLLTVILLIWIERKFAARIQDRIGPNRVGPFGLLQSVADALKMLTKEDITPSGADRVLYNLAPIITFATVVLLWAIVPFTPLHIWLRSQHRHPLLRCGWVHRRGQGDGGRVVEQQQVCAAGRVSDYRAHRQL